MNVPATLLGVTLVLVAMGTLYLTRRVLPGLDLDSAFQEYLRLLTALFASAMITLGLAVALLGLLVL